jgi:AraC family transcriptional regulator
MALALDECRRPIEISTFRWSSDATAWAGFPVASHVLGPSGQLREFGTEHALLGLCLSGVGEMKIRDGHSVRHVISSPGRLSLLCRGYEQKALEWSGTREMLYIGIHPGQLRGFTGDNWDLASSTIQPQYAVSNSYVTSLVLSMRSEIQSGCSNGRLYAEALSVALATRLRAQYSHEQGADREFERTLSPTQVRRVCEYIQTNLASDFGVAELAHQVNLSPHHFSMLFKHALGIPPHRYVLQERIREAQRQLAGSRMDISQLALQLGFSDQSHFSRAFRKMTGTTPKRYRSTH